MVTESSLATIAAIATPPGSGGIGIIRISGSSALSILQHLFQPVTPPCFFTSHRLYYGHIHDDGKRIDEVMAVFMKAPRSYTCEDVVEIHCHGNQLVLEYVLALVIKKGARLASPGEFTKRAFLNGRIDLTQAEAVVDLLSAKTRKGVDLAQEQLAGALYKAIAPIQKSLLQARAYVEVAIDFPDEDVEIIDHSDLIGRIEQEVAAPLRHLLQQAGNGRLYRDGISMVIAGVPNVGKSSLLNAMLQEDRALVTDIPGTTRDSIEEVIDIGGIPVRIVDTAGIREHAGEVEHLGIERARNLINKADLVLFVIDGSREFLVEDFELFQTVNKKPVLAVVNKCDIGSDFIFPDLPDLRGVVHISAKKQSGLDELRSAIFAEIISDAQWEESSCAPNLRHKVALEKAVAACNRILETLYAQMSYDLIAVDLQECLDCLADIVGESTTEDVLDVVFHEFCLGK